MVVSLPLTYFFMVASTMLRGISFSVIGIILELANSATFSLRSCSIRKRTLATNSASLETTNWSWWSSRRKWPPPHAPLASICQDRDGFNRIWRDRLDSCHTCCIWCVDPSPTALVPSPFFGSFCGEGKSGKLELHVLIRPPKFSHLSYIGLGDPLH